MKFLVVLLVVIFGVWLFTTRSRADAAPRRRDGRAAAPPPAAPQAMLECAHCGLHLPASDAVLDGSRVFCSDAHRRLGPRTPGP